MSAAVSILRSADGEPVALHDFGGIGHGGRPPILLGHGNGLNAGMWAAAVPPLAERFRCFGVDLRGHGACGTTDTGYSVDRARFAEDVLACVDAIGEPVAYAGHSLGGASAVHAALVRPEAFTGMWLFEPVLIPVGYESPDGAGPSFLIEASRRRRMVFDSVDDAVTRFMSKPPYSLCDPIAVRGYVAIGSHPNAEGGVRLSCEGENEARVYGTGEPLDFDLLEAITAPTVVAAGGLVDGPNALPPRMAPLVAEALGNGRLEVHHDVTHFGPMEAPEVVARSIIDHFS